MAELARGQVQTELAMKAFFERLDHAVAKREADTKLRIARGEAELKAYREDTDRRIARGETELKAYLDATDRDTRAMKKTWGDLANKMGTVLEDVVAPNVPRLAVEAFGFSEVEDVLIRATRTSRRGEKRQREWDVVCSGPGKVMVVDVKCSPSEEKIRMVPPRLEEFFDFFPEYEGRELIGVFGSWSIEPNLLPVVSEVGLYGIAMGEETMEVVARPLEGS